MSSLATAPRRATSGATPAGRVRQLGITKDLALGALLATGFAVIVFVATGGADLAPNTWVQIALIVAGAGSAVALVLRSRQAVRPPANSLATLVLFAALAALTYASIAWSVQPATSWLEANRTLSYLAVFGAAATLARLAPARWPAVTGAVGAVAIVVCGYALLTKVFPASLAASDHVGRLRGPFDYWNATGLMAALGLPVCVWAGARPAAGRAVRALTVPAIALLVTTMVLSYSRGALLAAVIGLACWFALAPLRLRGTLVLVVGTAAGAVATLWALAHHAITHDNATLAARTTAGHQFGLVLLVVVILGASAGVAMTFGMDRITLSAQLRRRIGTALVVLIALVPVAVIAGAAASSRGLTGQISHAWTTLTAASSNVGNNPGRLGQLGNSRGLYWREGLKVGEHAPLAGVGAGGFDTARTRYSTSSLAVAHAHSYLIETFADLGLIGVAVSLALAVAWVLACRRTLTGSRLVERVAAERTGLITLLSVVAIFSVSSLMDWTWFIPGVTVPGLVAAGWLAGRGPLAAAKRTETAAARSGTPETAHDRTATPGDRTAAPGERTAAPGDRTATPAERTQTATRGFSFTPERGAAALGVVLAALVAAWFVWQPLHSSDSFGAAIGAMERGDTATALADARAAANADPLSVDPLWEQSAIYGALGNQTAARAELVKATSLQPDNPQTWVQLGAFDLQRHQPRLAVAELQTASRLDRTSGAISQQLTQARTELLSATPARTGSA